QRHERAIMLGTFLVVAAIEITIAVTKPAALAFAVTVLALGFFARALHKGFRIELPATLSRVFPQMETRRQIQRLAAGKTDMVEEQLGRDRPMTAVMVAARGVTPTL